MDVDFLHTSETKYVKLHISLARICRCNAYCYILCSRKPINHDVDKERDFILPFIIRFNSDHILQIKKEYQSLWKPIFKVRACLQNLILYHLRNGLISIKK